MAREAIVFIDPPSHHFERDKLFDLGTAAYGGHDLLAPFVHLRGWLGERNIRVHTADLMDAVGSNGAKKIFMSFGMRERYTRLRDRGDVTLSAFFVFECPIVEPRLYLDLYPASGSFKRMFTWSEESALRPFLTGPVAFDRFRIPQAVDDVDDAIWQRRDRRFLVMINANKRPRLSLHELYTERIRAVEYFEKYGEIDLYGMGWDRPTIQLGETRVPATVRRMKSFVGARLDRLRPTKDPLLAAARRAYRGPIPEKRQTLGGYTFAICFENMILDGWITEKIFDCLCVGTIPVYLGPPDVEQWIPPECFVDMRKFNDYAELREYLRSLGPAEIDAYRQAAREFLRSEQYAPFRKRTFSELIGSLVENDAGIHLSRS